MSTPAQTPRSNILVVDDTPANLQLLTSMLKGRGYRVRPVSSGELALRAIETQPPNLILLDINMPEMDGYEVCRRLKADARWLDIPIIFISALNETEDKVRALQAGGVDYVCKPFQFEEVDARVRTHLELQRQKQQIRESYVRLQELEKLRDSLTHMMAHDMRSPLLAAQLAIELLENNESLPADTQPLISIAHGSIGQLLEMISQMLDVSRMESGKMMLHKNRENLVELTRDAMKGVEPLAGKRKLELQAPAELWLDCDRQIMRRVITNLVANAIKFTQSEGRIEVSVNPEGERTRVAVHDNGPGIPPEYHEHIFEKFGQVRVEAIRSGSGLGLTFAKMAVEAHGGQIGVTSALGQGSTFWFLL